jgi:IS5 family transposase
LKTQVVVNKANRRVICIAVSCGNKHDYKLYQESRLPILPETKVIADSGYSEIKKEHGNSEHPRKKSKKHPLGKEDKKYNRDIARRRVLNEHVIGFLKRFRSLSEKYRNRRKRFGLRFSLIAGICNFDL